MVMVLYHLLHLVTEEVPMKRELKEFNTKVYKTHIYQLQRKSL